MAYAIERAEIWPAGSKAKRIEQAYERGRRVGAAWATDTAAYFELKRLASVALHLRFDDEQVAQRVVSTILGERILSRPEIAEFRESIGIGGEGSAVESGDYWQGFVESAMDVFERVEI